jgi:extradiol dioxygenase family protein
MGAILFHLAFPSLDLEATTRFYVDGIGCELGRASTAAVTLGLCGHQLVAHLVERAPEPQHGIYPRHFGLVFTSREDWQMLCDRAKAKGLKFYQEPRRRFPNTRLEHATFFLEDPSGNLLEFKYYTYESAIFGERADARVGDSAERDGREARDEREDRAGNARKARKAGNGRLRRH